ncbi:protein-tyrosine sulfotransferase [Actinidia eriantha]|uniref:protein-tyrosine sulfotransferase n=1 Tax=Actinidia eriantha TaxID=165200 RepID=UPI002586A813|nr:protein-tyrosine sulfotransferase [Actinidia eriantha]XP_057474612.1 protein-tyrosine sulfotransferase [Actinidia eriantha]
MDRANKFAVLLVLLLYAVCASATSASDSKDDYEHCRSTVKKWASSSLYLEVKEDKHTLRDLLYFLHIPRTGGRTYFHCFLKKLYASSLECPRSYDKLRFDPSKPNCRLLATHDDYSMMSKLPKEKTSVMTILRNPIDRVFSTYEFSIEVAARFLVHPNLTSATQMVGRLRLKNKGVSTLDIWPWKYLVPWMREDLFARRDARRHSGPTYIRSNDSYNMEEIVMPLQEYINDPIARDIIHNGATFQIAGLTNNSYLAESHEVRHCILKYQTLGEHVLDVAKKRLDDMLYVGLTEDHEESATMFANVVGAQVISQSIASNYSTDPMVDDKSEESSSSLDSEPETSHHRNSSTGQKASKISSTGNMGATSKNMTVGKLTQVYETCISSLRKTQAQRRTSSLKRISPANFTKEARLRVPEVLLQEIKSLNGLDIKLYKYAQNIFSKQHKQMILKSAAAKMQVQGSQFNNAYGAPSQDIIWIAMSIALLFLFVALFVKARRRTSKIKL